MAKIENDKYYTNKELAKYIVDKTNNIIGEDNIICYLEPSAGAGVFLDYLRKPCLAYDIEPEDDERIVQQDYLTLKIMYKKGRCVIGNPPYGRVNNLAVQFYKKSIQLGDYISFILPISQLNNNIKMYEFDLIYSEDLGIREYSNINIHCCFNIYRRPSNNKLNKKPKYKLKDIEIRDGHKGTEKRQSIITKDVFDYDIKIKAWGGSTDIELNTLGEEIKDDKIYAQEFYIKIYNEKFKDDILKLLREVNWLKIYPMTATPKLQQWQVYKYIKDQFPEIT